MDEDPYFSVQALMERQITLLDSLNPMVRITGALQQKDEAIQVRKDRAAWAASLKLFTDADINQPVLQGQYTVKDTFDAQHNLSLRLYEAKRGADTSIPYLKVYYQDTLTQVKRIETIFREDNLLYDTQRKMSADFEMVQGQPRLMQYETIGEQKMLLQDSVHYRMQATIDYDA